MPELEGRADLMTAVSEVEAELASSPFDLFIGKDELLVGVVSADVRPIKPQGGLGRGKMR